MIVTVRAYGPLNDFLPIDRRYAAWDQTIDGQRSVKDLIESAGIPHPEIDLILVNGASVPFEHAVRSGDRIAVFPQFRSFDVAAVTRVRPRRLDSLRFVVDVHLGKLARHLRLLGLDTLYRPDADDAALAEMAALEDRVLLTRDRGLLKRRQVQHGYFIRHQHPHRQLVEVLRRFDRLAIRPFSRCLRCNAALQEVSKSAIDAALLPLTRHHYDCFHVCSGCGRIYWKGSHWKRLTIAIDTARAEAESSPHDSR